MKWLIFLCTPCFVFAKLKILILVIASDNAPLYREEQKLWQMYMHSDPDIDAFFIKGNPKQKERVEIHGSTCYLKVKDCLCPGILQKTLLAIDHFAKEYDYIVRTNLSSFYNFKNLKSLIRRLPRSKCYAGGYVQYGGIPFASGSGFILSQDVARIIARRKNDFWNYTDHLDDVAIGIMLRQHKLRIISLPRVDIRGPQDINAAPHDAFHYRLKQYRRKENGDRELKNMKALIKKFY